MSTKDTHTGGDPLRGVLETVLESAKKKKMAGHPT